MAGPDERRKDEEGGKSTRSREPRCDGAAGVVIPRYRYQATHVRRADASQPGPIRTMESAWDSREPPNPAQ